MKAERPAFDDDHRPVPAEDFDWQAIEPEPEGIGADPKAGLVLGVLAYLCECPDPKRVWRRLQCLTYLLKLPGAPESLAELGKRLGCSKQAAFESLTRFRRDLARNGQKHVAHP